MREDFSFHLKPPPPLLLFGRGRGGEGERRLDAGVGERRLGSGVGDREREWMSGLLRGLRDRDGERCR